MPEGQKIIEDRYLADGGYASYTGFGIALDLRAQSPSSGITRIVLDEEALDALLKYIEDVAAAVKKAAFSKAKPKGA